MAWVIPKEYNFKDPRWLFIVALLILYFLAKRLWR